MFVGHIGAGMAVASLERRVNVGAFVTAALLLDLLLWSLVLVGAESVRIPPDFADTRQAAFHFPLSHGLLAAFGWSVLAAIAISAAYARLGEARLRAGVLAAASVMSHWLLDAWVHRPELPLAGEQSARIGLSLWNDLPLALMAEALVTLAGLLLFLHGSAIARGRSGAMAAATLLVLGFTVVGMTVAPPPPSATAMAASSLVTLVAVCCLFGWLGRLPHGRGA